MFGFWKLVTRTSYVTMLSILDGLYQGSPPPMKNNVHLSKKNVLLSWTNSKNFLKLCYKIIYNFTNTSPILNSSRILRFKTLNFSLNIKQSRLCFKPISDYFRCCFKVSIHGANIIDHDVAIALVIKRRTAGKIKGVSKSITSYKFIYVNSIFYGFGTMLRFFRNKLSGRGYGFGTTRSDKTMEKGIVTFEHNSRSKFSPFLTKLLATNCCT